MDKSETYIKMRLGAKADLGVGYPPTRFRGDGKPYWDDKGDCYVMYKDASWCQLERQDQLQEIVFDEYSVTMPFALVRILNRWCELNTIGQFTSMEQLWLAYVMKEKYGKTWDGETWLIT